jgi:tetratricopeptide (TPR) repeat protein
MGFMASFRAIAVAVFLAPALAAAQPQPTAKQKQQASELVQKAIAKSQAGDHEEAVDLYLNAYAIIPQPLLLSNIGSEYQQMKKPVEALKYFCRYLEADPTGANVGYASAQARTLYIELGGVTTVEDKDLCKPIVKPAPAVEPKPEPPPAPSPAPPPQPQPAETPTAKPPTLRYAGAAVAVVGAGVFGLGTYYGLEAKKISDEITNHDVGEPWPANIKAREEEGKSAEKKQIMFMIGGGVAIAAGVTMFFLGAPKSAPETSVSVAPIATSDTLGFAAAGRF